MPDPTYAKLIREVEQIIRKLKHGGDIREWPDSYRGARFLAGWRDATERRNREPYTSKILEKLTWQNLGWRLGKKYGPRSRDEIVTFYEILSEHYQKSRPKDRRPR
jgi:hypothetical protein